MNVGLRERKKMRTRAAIQKEAFRLFLDHGYDETTIEDIAEAADISPSTFFNYYPSKEAVVFEDEYDPMIIAAFDAQPDATTKPIHALRLAIRHVFERIGPEQMKLVRQRTELFAKTPELRSAMLSQFAELADQIADLLAERAGKNKDDFAVHNLAGALLGVMMSVMIMISENPKADLLRTMDSALEHLEEGLPLDWPFRG
ncbi:MAG TPA: TetR family transcriptional regulator [Candidatus Dormibacteraeota bacterium]|nr:TetR family transcriptional regulator [Candidatus Dormibacteraeota bacterium]